MNSVLVTGGAGFIGHHLVNRLLLAKTTTAAPADIQVTVIDNLSGGKESNIPKHHNVSFYNEDIRNKESISDIIKRKRVDCCIHLAAKVSIREDNNSEIKSNNVDGTLSVLQACAENKVNDFVFASSAAVYGEAKSLPIREEHPLNPISSYGTSKKEGEKMVFAFKETNKIKHAMCLRFFNVYGKGQNPVYAGVISKFAERIVQTMPPVIYGDGEQTRDFISVNDAVNAIIMAANSSSDISGAFNIGTGQAIAIRDLADKMLKIASLNIGPVYQQRSIMVDGEIKHSVADTTKSMEFLKFVAKDKLDESLARLLGDLGH